MGSTLFQRRRSINRILAVSCGMLILYLVIYFFSTIIVIRVYCFKWMIYTLSCFYLKINTEVTVAFGQRNIEPKHIKHTCKIVFWRFINLLNKTAVFWIALLLGYIYIFFLIKVSYTLVGSLWILYCAFIATTFFALKYYVCS